MDAAERQVELARMRRVMLADDKARARGVRQITMTSDRWEWLGCPTVLGFPSGAKVPVSPTGRIPGSWKWYYRRKTFVPLA